MAKYRGKDEKIIEKTYGTGDGQFSMVGIGGSNPEDVKTVMDDVAYAFGRALESVKKKKK